MIYPTSPPSANVTGLSLSEQLDRILANNMQHASPMSDAVTTQIPPIPNSLMIDPVSLAQLPLSQINIDPDQPRRYLPADLRQAVILKTISPPQMMAQLMARAAQEDAEAYGYLNSIRELAHSISEVGLQQPVRVRIMPTANQYWLIDGERRYWAQVYQASKAGIGDLAQITLAALIDPGPADPLQTLRAQWAANLQREDVPAIDYTDTIKRIYESLYYQAQHQRAEVVKKYTMTDNGTRSPRELALQLTANEVFHLTTRDISPDTVYLYLRLADQLSATVKQLARAHLAPLRVLKPLLGKPDEEQLRLLNAALGLTPAASKQGNKRQRRSKQDILQVTQLRLRELVSTQSYQRRLKKYSAEQLQSAVSEIDSTTEALRKHADLLKRHLTTISNTNLSK